MKHIIYLTLFFLSGAHVFGYSRPDSLNTAASETDSTALKVDYYLSQASLLTDEKPLDAVQNYRKALLSARKRDELWEAAIRTEMGKLLLSAKSKEALTQLATAESLFAKHSDVQGRAGVLNLMAQFYLNDGQQLSAQKKYIDLYKVQMDAGEAVLAGNAAMTLTNIFLKTKNYKDAFVYADMAKNAYESVCRRDSLGSIYLKIARIKRGQNKVKLAEYYTINKALPFFSSADFFQGRIMSFNFLGDMYRDRKSYSQAKWFYLQANTQSRSINDTTALIKSLLDLSVIQMLTGNYDLAKRDLSEAEELSKDSGSAHLTKAFRDRFPKLLKKLDAPVLQTAVAKEDVAAVQTLPVKKEAVN